jgi:hypothetical protein
MKITYVQNVLLFKKILAIALIVFGLIMMVSNVLLGLFGLGLGISLAGTEGSEIDLHHRTYRNIKSIFGIKFGKWMPIPEFEYVSVFNTSERTRVYSMGAQMANFKDDVIVLNLFYNRSKHITFYKTKDVKDAFEVAEHFRLALGVDILDATTKEKKWL